MSGTLMFHSQTSIFTESLSKQQEKKWNKTPKYAHKEVEQDSKILKHNMQIHSHNYVDTNIGKNGKITKYLHKVLQSTLVKKTDGKLTDEENCVRNICFGTNRYKATYVLEYWYK
jgi:hypothetical protein